MKAVTVARRAIAPPRIQSAREATPYAATRFRQRARRRPKCLPVTPAVLNLALHHLALVIGDRLGRVETLGAGLGAVHDGVAAIKPEGFFEIVEPLASRFIAAVD